MVLSAAVMVVRPVCRYAGVCASARRRLGAAATVAGKHVPSHLTRLKRAVTRAQVARSERAAASGRVCCGGLGKCRQRRHFLGPASALACSCTATRCASCRCSEVRRQRGRPGALVAPLLAPLHRNQPQPLMHCSCLLSHSACPVCVPQTRGSWQSVQDWAAWPARMSSRGRRVVLGCAKHCVAPAG